MRAYKITRKAGTEHDEAVRFGGSQTEANQAKKDLLADAGLRPQADANQVTIEQIDIPTGKADLIPFLNKLVG